MKILHTVESYLPARHGMSEVVRQISERLVAGGHDVTVATSRHPLRASEKIAGVHIESFAVVGKSAIGISGQVQAYRRFVLESDFDVIVNFAAQQWATDLVFPVLPKISAKKIFVPTGFSALGDPLFRSYFEQMPGWMRHYDACVYLSDDYRDIRFAREAGLDNEVIIPNGAAADEFGGSVDSAFRSRIGIPPGQGLIIHVSGYLSVAKGQVEAVRIFSESGIRDSTLLLICGEFSQGLAAGIHPRKLARGAWQMLRGRGLSGFVPAWQIAGWARKYTAQNRVYGRKIARLSLSREDTVNAFLDADLLLFPSWIECSPLVLFESAAAGTPFLVTDVGNSREIVSWTGGGEILPGRRMTDREGSFVADVVGGARMLDRLWADGERRAAMAQQAKAAWRGHFTWEKIAAQYEELYKALVAGLEIRGRFPAPPSVYDT